MKAIIPVAGPGTNLRPHTYTQPKALIPVAGKPILGFIIDQMVEAGVTEFVFVIGYLGDKIEDYVNKSHPEITPYFVRQQQRRGLGHAIYLAKEHIDPDEEVLIVLGDTIVEADIIAFTKHPYSALGVKKVNDPRNFGVAEFGAENMITRVVEKPLIPKSNHAIIGIYKIKETGLLFGALEEIEEKHADPEDQIQLTDAIMIMIERGAQFTGFPVDNWYDCGQREILLETNKTLLKKTGYPSENLPLYENTIIIHPVNIAPGTKIKNSIVGPNVTIAENADINYSIIHNTIIGPFTRLENVMLRSSVVGSDALIRGAIQSLNIGDDTEIDLSGEG